MTKNFYITSPIYYVNDVPHIGHAYTSIACDVLARYHRAKSDQVLFLTGTDEHGQKVEKSAIAKQKTPQQFCDEVSQKFRELSPLLNLSNDDFIRTTQDRHQKTVEKIWQIMEANGFIYKDVYQGWYALRDEAFYQENELIDGKAPTGAEVQWHCEESYFFKLSAFQDKLLALYQAVEDFVMPNYRMNEVINFVKSGLKDLSISRTSFSWGIKVKNDPSHVIYVWLDALTNYLSALDFAKDDCFSNANHKFQQFWVNANQSPIHVVGKDILRFHAIYWPAFLMACNLNVPYSIIAHGWWTNQGQKISKSLGNVIDPNAEIQWLESLGCSTTTATDYFRYFLLREVPFGNDGDYHRNHLITRIDSELANNIGNLVQRSLTMIINNCQGLLPANNNSQLLISDEVNQLIDQYFSAFDNYQFDRSLEAVILIANLANKNFNDLAPWNLKKLGKISEMNYCLNDTVQQLKIIAILLLPFIPDSANKILDLLSLNLENRNFVNLTTPIQPNTKINSPSQTFPRLQNNQK